MTIGTTGTAVTKMKQENNSCITIQNRKIKLQSLKHHPQWNSTQMETQNEIQEILKNSETKRQECKNNHNSTENTTSFKRYKPLSPH